MNLMVVAFAVGVADEEKNPFEHKTIVILRVSVILLELLETDLRFPQNLFLK